MTSTTTNQKANTLIVFDWDNTLFPTHFLTRKRGGKRINIAKFKQLLEELSRWVYRVLCAYITHYSAQNICIVTAGREGCLEMFLSKLGKIGLWSDIRRLLFDSEHRIEMLHPPRTILPFKTSTAVCSYKHSAFISLIQRSSDQPRVFVSIGDSSAEYDAAAKCGARLEGLCVGRVRLKQFPSLSCLIRQSQFILDLCATLEMDTESFDIDISMMSTYKLSALKM